MSTTYDRFPIVDTQRYKIVRMFRDSSRTYTIARGNMGHGLTGMRRIK